MGDQNLTQGVAAVVALLTGVALGLCLDARRALGLAGRPGRLAGHALDVACVAAMTPVLAAGLLLADWGALRLYVLLATGAGLALYLTLGSPVVLPVGVWLLRAIARIVGWTLRAVLWPFRATVRVFWPPLARVGRWSRRTVGQWRRRPPAPPSSD